ASLWRPDARAVEATARRRLPGRRPRAGQAGQTAEETGPEYVAEDRAERGQEPRNPPHACQTRSQSPALEAHRDRPSATRCAAERQSPPPVRRGTASA